MKLKLKSTDRSNAGAKKRRNYNTIIFQVNFEIVMKVKENQEELNGTHKVLMFIFVSEHKYHTERNRNCY
jgi:hypothetical protein